METGEITIAGENKLELVFDSSWRAEAFDDGPGPSGGNMNNQTAVIAVSYDGGNTSEILRWESDPESPAYKDDATDETVTIPLDVPVGATALELRFGLINAGDDWWWAIDNLRIIAPGTGVAGDFNGDSVADVADMNLLASEIASGANDSLFDLNGDTLVNTTDRDIFLGGNIITSGNKLNGDTDFSGQVLFPDFVALADKFGQSGLWSQGDFDANGVVQFPDFVILANNFGKSAPAAAAVPEPGSALLLAAGVLSLLGRRNGP
jgi:hypothetical protein